MSQYFLDCISYSVNYARIILKGKLWLPNELWLIVDSYNTFDLHKKWLEVNLKFPSRIPESNPNYYIMNHKKLLHTWCIETNKEGECEKIIEMYGYFLNPMNGVTIQFMQYGTYYKYIRRREDVIGPYGWIKIQ